MQLKAYRAQARTLLRGKWLTMSTFVVWWLVLPILINAGITSLFGSHSFGYQMTDTFAQYFLYFILLDAVFLASLKLIHQQIPRLTDGLLLFKRPVYVDLIVLNFFQQVLNWVLLLIALVPFSGFLGWSKVAHYTFNGIETALPYFEQVAQQDTIAPIFLALLLVILVATLIQPLIQVYYQILVLLKLDFPSYSLKMLLPLSFILLKGQWWRLFKLVVSFIGWALLAVMTAGIGLLWFYPYLTVTITLFYQDLKNQRIKVVNA